MKLILLSFALLIFGVANIHADETVDPNILLRMYQSSGWGAIGHEERQMRILKDGSVECFIPEFKGYSLPTCREEWTDECHSVWEERILKKFENALSVEEVASVEAKLAILSEAPATNHYNCFDDLYRAYDTGHWDAPEFTFMRISASRECGFEGKEADETGELMDLMNSWYARCPLLEGDDEWLQRKPLCFPEDKTCKYEEEESEDLDDSDLIMVSPEVEEDEEYQGLLTDPLSMLEEMAGDDEVTETSSTSDTTTSTTP